MNVDLKVSNTRAKRNTGLSAPHGNQIETMPERSASLSILPIIPEKGDPTLALQEPGKNSGIPIQNRYGRPIDSKQY